MILTATTGTYIHPSTFGQYPNAYIDYIGETQDIDNQVFTFRFAIISEAGYVIQNFYWGFQGTTPSGSTIQDHGVIISGGTSGATEEMDFISFTQAGGDYDYSGHTIVRYPQLSYEDITTYFVLGGKKDKVQLPNGANPKKLVKWMLLNTLTVNREQIKTQFSW